MLGKTEAAPARPPSVGGKPARLPEGLRLYAVGDIHGRADLLVRLYELIAEDAAHAPPGTELVLVYVGDYVDRGLESAKVLDRLIERPLAGFRTIHLLGNHDAWLLAFLDDVEVGPAWLRFGGDTTLLSYGLRPMPPADDEAQLEQLQKGLRECLPAAHRAFLESLPLSFELGDYLFVHAGVRPGVPLERQEPQDLLWIREPFLSFGGDLGRVVVHGHTVQPEPVLRANRIGIDIGACWTGRLCCLVLEGETQRFLEATSRGAGHAAASDGDDTPESRRG
jgi:serine/threonine protein phosphatase 1